MGAESKDPRTGIFVVSGTQGAGKTTVSRLLAERFERGVHVSADVLQRMIVSGLEWPKEHARGVDTRDDEARRQLRLRLQNMCLLGRSFHDAGFAAVMDDIIVGRRLQEVREELSDCEFMFVMLLPDRETVRAREHERGTELWREWEWLTDSIPESTERVGLWLDTSAQTPEETVDEIMRRAWDEAVVRPTVAVRP